ncbi:DUF3383 family protein [Acetobacterium wieringae]|uniref:DUF3383 family protein n=1 Tax=Acetobacterium wieringae TaxID=52694 RepID=UPI002B1F795F|nr:DUF3383 family protein [Acetobacterium wieringae]MEA4805085.1 DUF3383 family protein [Acetobacterium wieringae]
MSRLNDFKSSIKLSTAAEVRQEFGGILLFETDTDHPYTTYKDLPAVLLDFAITTDTYKMAARIFNQELSPSGISIVGDATETPAEITAKLDTLINKNWYGLVCTDNATATITALDAWVDDQEKVYVVTTQTLSDIGTMTSKRTFIGFHDSADAYLMEGLLSYMLTHDIGSATAKFKKIIGVPEANITDPQLATLRAAHGVTYIEEMDNLETSGSQTASGERFDVVLGEDWINYNLEKEMHDLAVKTQKIGYSGKGIASLVGVATNVLNKAAKQGIILVEKNVPQFSITYKERADVPQADRAARKYDGIIWSAYLEGAIEGGATVGELLV